MVAAAAIAKDDLREMLASLSPQEKVSLAYNWKLFARKGQLLPDGKWDNYVIKSGRGWGKTRVGAEAVRYKVNHCGIKRINLVARTAPDYRDTMVEGESGLEACCAGDLGNVPEYQPSKRRVVWPNGAIALLFSAEEPDALRGPQCEFYWCDELASWKYPDDTWDNLQFGARLGDHVQGIITTTPRRIKLLSMICEDPNTIVYIGSTYENISNLSENYIKNTIAKYEGTKIGRREIYGEDVDDDPDALWSRITLDQNRVRTAPKDLAAVVIGVDPAISDGANDPDNRKGAESGIIAVGRLSGPRSNQYVLGDFTVPTGNPEQWATAAIRAYRRFAADCIVAEANQGGLMVEYTLKTIDPTIPIKLVHASRGKRTRAEPVSAMYQQGRVHHVGAFPALEDQMCSWIPGMDSPDRMDALVWACTQLMGGVSAKPALIDRRRLGF